MSQNLLEFLQSACSFFLKNENFVVKIYLENEEKCYFIIVSEKSNVDKIKQHEYNGDTSFLEELYESTILLAKTYEFFKEIKIELEVINGN